MPGNADISGPRAPPQPFQQPEMGPGDFRREVPDVSLVFNPNERSALISARGPLLATGRAPPPPPLLQEVVRRSSSVPSRFSDPPPLGSPPAPLHPSPLTRSPAPPLSDLSAAADGRQMQPPAAAVAPRPSSQSPQSTAQSPRGAVAIAGAHSGGGISPEARFSDGAASHPPPVAGGKATCCGAELRAVLRIVADNGRQLTTLRRQLAALLAREERAGAAPRTLLVREAETQTEAGRRPATAAAGVNTSLGLLKAKQRDAGTDPPPSPPRAPPAEPLSRGATVPRRVLPNATRSSSADAAAVWPQEAGRQCSRTARAGVLAADWRGSGTPPQRRPTASGTPAQRADSETLNTAQVQARRVQEWVEADGWAGGDEQELTLRGVVLPPVAEQPPSPEPSLHVELQEYQPSQDGSEDDSEDEVEEERPGPDKTFFQNVMGQVNQILDGARVGVAAERPPPPEQHRQSRQQGQQRLQLQQQDGDSEGESDPVRRATLRQLRAAGVSFQPAPAAGTDRSVFDYSCVPRAAAASPTLPCSTDLSLEMNTLAMKYVDNRQLMQRAAAVGGRSVPHPVESRLLGKENLAPVSGRGPTDMTLYGISDSNMSFSTRKYMEKFNLQSS